MLPISDPVIEDTIERLTFEFAGCLPVSIIATVVRRSQHDLDSCPLAALPELWSASPDNA